MNQTDLYPEMLRPYDPRHTPLPPPTEDVCAGPVVNVCMNVSWWSHVSGMIARLAYRDAWQGTEDEIDSAIESVYKILNVGEPSMSCGCGCKGEPNRTRVTPDGKYQVSYDGGETWEDGSDFDPRVTAPRLPPLPGADSDSKRCQAAGNVEFHFQDHANQIGNDATLWASIHALIAAFVTLLIFLSAISLGALTPIILGLAAALITGGKDAFIAAMTGAVWDTFNCIIYCHLGEDGVLESGGIDAIVADINEQLTGIAALYLSKTVLFMGEVGINNMAATSTGVDADCLDCACSDTCPTEWQVVTGYGDIFGTILSQDETQVTVQTTGVNTNGNYYCYLWSGSPSLCCYMNSWEVLSGGTVDLAVGDCGASLLDVHGGLIGEGCYNQFQPQSNAPFTVRFHLATCP